MTSASVTAAGQPFNSRTRHQTEEARTILALYDHARAGQAPPQLEGAISLIQGARIRSQRKDRLHFKLERKERCTPPMALDPLRQAEPEVKAELTRTQNNDEELPIIRRAKLERATTTVRHCARLQERDRNQPKLGLPFLGKALPTKEATGIP